MKRQPHSATTRKKGGVVKNSRPSRAGRMSKRIVLALAVAADINNCLPALILKKQKLADKTQVSSWLKLQEHQTYPEWGVVNL